MIFKVKNSPYEVEIILDELDHITLWNDKEIVKKFTSMDETVEYIADNMLHCDRCGKDKHYFEMVNAVLCADCWGEEVDETYERIKRG